MTTMTAPTDATRRRMRAQRTAGTVPELVLRAACRRQGMAPRHNLPVRVPGGRPITPDLVWPGRRVAVFVHGCAWHGCATHWRVPRTNGAWWTAKIAANRSRDARQARRLRAAGWAVVTVWEHDDMDRAARRIATVVRSR